MDDRPRYLLVQLITQYGHTLATDPKRCRSLLSDHPQDMSQRQRTALLWALEHGLYQALMDGVQQQPVALLLPRLTQNLLDQAPFEAQAARWAVESWAVALGLLPSASPAPGQSGVRPAPAPRPATTAPPPGQVELVVPLRDLTLTLRSGDTVRGDVTQPLTLASPLGGRLEGPEGALVSVHGERWTFADGTVLHGLLSNDTLTVHTPRRDRSLPVEQLQPLAYQAAAQSQEASAALCLSLEGGQRLMGRIEVPLTFTTAVETLQLDSAEIVALVDGRLGLDDGSSQTGTITAPDPLPVQTRYGLLAVPVAQVQRLQHVWTNSLGLVFATLPAGEFRMGSATGSDDEKPVHTVRLSQPFAMGIYPVTQAQWQAIMGDNPSCFVGDLRRPVERVSWEDVQHFLQQLNTREPGAGYRLPTEAEWEYAARAGSSAAYCYGDDERQLARYAWYHANAGWMTHPVGTLQPNAWGLHDMHGNVWELVQDIYDSEAYKKRAAAGTAAVDPAVGAAGAAAAGAYRVIRGGSWGNGAGDCRAAGRGHIVPGGRSDILGFRLLRAVP